MATVRLTKTRVEAFKRDPDGPDTQRLCDSAERGLVIDVTRLGDKVWKHRYIPPGKMSQAIVKFGEFPSYSVEEARRKVQKQKQVLAEGRDPRFTAGDMTVKEFYLQIINDERYFKAESTRKSFRINIKNWVIPVIGGYKVSKVRRIDVRGVLDRILAKDKEGACRVTHANMRMLFKNAVNEGIIEDSPVRDIQMKYITSGRRTRYLSTVEIREVMNLPDLDPESLLLKFLLLSGCRITEARLLKWEDIYDGIVHFPDTKTDPHSLPILPMLENLLGRAKNLSGRREYVFASLRAVGSPVWDKFVRERLHSIVSDATPHALRHTLATLMDELEIPMERVSLVLNHAIPGMTAKYSHSKSLGKKAKALRKYYRRIEEIVST